MPKFFRTLIPALFLAATAFCKRCINWGGARRPTRCCFPSLEGFEKGGFQGFGASGMTYD